MREAFAGILDRLDRHAALKPSAAAYTFLQDGQDEGETLTFADLRGRALAVAAALQERLQPGDRALLLYPPGLDFIPAFLGCLYCGVVAVPAYPPRRSQKGERVLGIAADCGAKAVLTVTPVRSAIESLAETVPQVRGLDLLCTDTLGPAPAAYAPRLSAADDLAFLQYTSGSTAFPKGVMVTHGNIMHNERLIQEAFGHDEKTVVVGWLPLFHDMGLLGNTLQPLYLGTHCILMAPLAFLQRPLRWLEAISRFGATTSGGPNFAYDLCTAHARKSGVPEGLDLSRWSLAYVGAEPVRAGTLRNFAAAFKRCGFKWEALYPCFGLAEGTLFTTGGRKAEPPVIARWGTGPLLRGQARRTRWPGKRSRQLVGCGRAPADLDLRIVDPATGTPVPELSVGEIWVSGPSIARGYFGQAEATLETFGAVLAGIAGTSRGSAGSAGSAESDRAKGDGPTFLRTGDLGFLDRGELFVTGRLKDLIIIRGRNYYPQDIELAVEQCHPGVRTGCTAAFGVQIEGREGLAVAAEVDRLPDAPAAGGGADPLQEILDRIRGAVAAEFELQIAQVALLRAHSIPRTSSGKIRRGHCRDLLLGGKLNCLRTMVSA